MEDVIAALSKGKTPVIVSAVTPGPVQHALRLLLVSYQDDHMLSCLSS